MGAFLFLLLIVAAGTVVLFSTHDEAEAAAADRVLVMDDGVLREP